MGIDFIRNKIVSMFYNKKRFDNINNHNNVNKFLGYDIFNQMVLGTWIVDAVK